MAKDDDLFDDPGQSDKVDWEEHSGRLLLIYPLEKVEGIQTDYGESDAIRANVVALDGPGAPEEFKNTLVFPRVLQGQLRNNVGTGRPVIGRLGQGEKKKGQSPPWQLRAATETDKQKARDYVNRKPAVDEPPF